MKKEKVLLYILLIIIIILLIIIITKENRIITILQGFADITSTRLDNLTSYLKMVLPSSVTTT